MLSFCVLPCCAAIITLKIADYFCSSSANSSIFCTNSLGLICKAIAILQMVVKFACFVPFSIIVKWVRAIPANPLKTSCDNPLDLRRVLMVYPTILSSNSNRLTALFQQIVCEKRHSYVCDSRHLRNCCYNDVNGCF